MPAVRIHYHRPPDRSAVYVQALVHRTDDVIVTLNECTPLKQPVIVDGRVVLEEGSPVVWFTFPGAWHDIGRFHRADGTFTGFYANILTPVRFLNGNDWATTDLYLDVWLEPGRPPVLLDEDEFNTAVERGWLDPATAGAARTEAARLMALAAGNAWPPASVMEWTLERAREHVAGPAGDSAGDAI